MPGFRRLMPRIQSIESHPSQSFDLMFFSCFEARAEVVGAFLYQGVHPQESLRSALSASMHSAKCECSTQFHMLSGCPPCSLAKAFVADAGVTAFEGR